MIEHLPPLPSIMGSVEASCRRIASVEREAQRETLADRVWIGVCCLAAKEHHKLPESQRGQGRKKITSPRRSDSDATDLSLPNPQGFLSWLREHVPDFAQPTLYRYMEAAIGAGLTAWSDEKQVRRTVARLLRDHEDASVRWLAARAGETEDDLPPGPVSPPPPPVQLTFDDLLEYRTATAEIREKLDSIPPKTHRALVEDSLQFLQDLTGQKWEPTGKL